MIRDLSLNQLRYAIALDDHRNFTRAAEYCHITQPTLSIQLKKLETSLGVELFDRSKNPVVPTAAGRRFLERSRRVVREMDQIVEEIDWMKSEMSGEITIGVIPTLAPYLVPAFIGEFSQQYPGVYIRVEELMTTDMVEKLSSDKIDAGILVGPLNQKGIHLQPLFYEEIRLYCNLNHPFLGKDEIEASDLKSGDLWILGEGHCFREQILNLCSIPEHADPRNINYESSSLETLKRLVDVEGGFTLMPELAVNTLAPDFQKMTRPIVNPRPLREVSLATARTFTKRKLLEELARFIAESVPRSMLEAERGTVVEWQS
jgi:LysR family transcriptional regulator, hydrogen peroxide-inducible genes activator